MQRLSRDSYWPQGLTCRPPLLHQWGSAIYLEKIMGYSRAYAEDVFYNIVECRDIGEQFRLCVGAEADHEFIEEAREMLRRAVPGLADVKSYGAVWKGQRDVKPGFSIRPDTVQDVFGILMQLQGDPYNGTCTFEQDSLARSRKWCGSYYLKHVAEWLRKQMDREVYYVSNGEYIIGHTLFLKYAALTGRDGELLPKFIRKDRAPNLEIRMPSIFGIIEKFYDRRIQDGRL